LRDVSLHPVISLHVNEIIYEADRVDHYDQQEDWERDVVDSEYLANLSPESVAGLQLMLPDNPKKVYHEYSRKKLDSGWKRYQALHKEQLVSTLVFRPCFPPLFSALEFAFEDSACEAALVAISVLTVGKDKKGKRLLEMYVQARATTEAWIEDRSPVLLFSSQFIIPGLPLTNIDPKDKQQIPYFCALFDYRSDRFLRLSMPASPNI
jgi:hypothetical protein